MFVVCKASPFSLPLFLFHKIRALRHTYTILNIFFSGNTEAESSHKLHICNWQFVLLDNMTGSKENSLVILACNLT